MEKRPKGKVTIVLAAYQGIDGGVEQAFQIVRRAYPQRKNMSGLKGGEECYAGLLFF